MLERAARALLAALVVLLLAAGARAETQSQALRRAEQAERAFDFDGALSAYTEALALAPHSRLSRRAAQRIAYLKDRSEGDFRPLVAFEKQRRVREPNAAQLEAFERQVNGFPAGRVRRESRALIADTFLLRLEQPERAVSAYEAWLAEPGLDDADWMRATNGLAIARARLGDLSGSLDTLKKAGLGARTEATYVELALVRRWARPASFLILGAFVVLGLIFGARKNLLSGLSPLSLFAVAWTAGLPLVIAARHRPETWRTMLFLAPGTALVTLLALLIGPGLERSSQRRVLVVLGVLSHVAVVYLALDHSEALLGLVMSFRRG